MAAEALLEGAEEILKANKEDVAAAREKGMKPGLIDRLMLSESRIQAMAEGLLQVAALEDPYRGVSLHEAAAKWTSDRPEAGSPWRGGDHLRGQA